MNLKDIRHYIVKGLEGTTVVDNIWNTNIVKMT